MNSLTHSVAVEEQHSVRISVVFDAHVERVNAVVIRRLRMHGTTTT